MILWPIKIRKIAEFQAESLGFQNFAWLGLNPSYAPDQYQYLKIKILSIIISILILGKYTDTW